MKTKIVFLLLTLFGISCYFRPAPLYVLKPQPQQEGYWLWGKFFQVKQAYSLEVALAYDRSYQGYYKFNIVIKNNTNAPVLVDPTQFYYQLAWLTPEKPKIDRIYAIDPEQEILKLAKQESRELATYQSDQANRALISFFDLLGDLANSNDNSDDDHLQNDVADLKNDLEHEKQMQSIEKELHVWQEEALRKTTLPPSFQIRGDVFFPVKPDVDKLVIHVVVNHKEFLFHFNQDVVK